MRIQESSWVFLLTVSLPHLTGLQQFPHLTSNTIIGLFHFLERESQVKMKIGIFCLKSRINFNLWNCCLQSWYICILIALSKTKKHFKVFLNNFLDHIMTCCFKVNIFSLLYQKHLDHLEWRWCWWWPGGLPACQASDTSRVQHQLGQLRSGRVSTPENHHSHTLSWF